MMAADVEGNGSTFEVGAIRQLFEAKAKGIVYFADVVPDGQKFLVETQVSAQSIPALTLVTHWDAALKKK